jgi:molybdate transport system ATP-binding protein
VTAPEALVELAGGVCRISAHRQLRVPAMALYPGQHWCVFGGNGAGKSLLAAWLSGRLTGVSQPSFAGGFDPVTDICEVSFAEQQRWWRHDDRHDVSEFNASAMDAGTTVARLIAGDPADPARLEAMLTLLDIDRVRNQGIRFLSSGQVRRALLARALYRQPRLLILDNPLESIDRISAGYIRDAIAGWMSADNCTLQLSRRRGDLLPGITHMALMQNLAMTAQGLPAAVLGNLSDDQRPSAAARLLPEQLPAACAGREQTPAQSGQCLLSLRGVSAAYGDTVVFRDLHWEMRWGQHALIEGPNGSGKSTILGLIDGDNHKAYGQPIWLFGRLRGTGESVWQIKSRFGIVSNELHNRYVKGWRVLDVVVSGFFDSQGLYDDSGAAEVQTARQWLQVMGLESRNREYYHELSFGEQRLVLLARAMVKQPWILVLDEASVGLDDHHRELLMRLLGLIAKSGVTQIIYVSHDDEPCPAFINQRLTFHKPCAMVPATISVQESTDGAGQ